MYIQSSRLAATTSFVRGGAISQTITRRSFDYLVGLVSIRFDVHEPVVGLSSLYELHSNKSQIDRKKFGRKAS